jgi:hypothetical protein
MGCKASAKGVTIHHNLLLELGALLCSAQETRPRQSWQWESCWLQMLREWGDILALLPDIVLVVANVSVVHPGAASYMRAAAQTDGTAAVSRDTEKWAKYGVGK